MIDVIKDNLSAMLLDINDKVSTVATEVGKTPGSWNSEVFTFIKSINENVVLPIAAIILTAILCIELIQMVIQKNNMHERSTFEPLVMGPNLFHCKIARMISAKPRVAMAK